MVVLVTPTRHQFNTPQKHLSFLAKWQKQNGLVPNGTDGRERLGYCKLNSDQVLQGPMATWCQSLLYCRRAYFRWV